MIASTNEHSVSTNHYMSLRSLRSLLMNSSHPSGDEGGTYVGVNRLVKVGLFFNTYLLIAHVIIGFLCHHLSSFLVALNGFRGEWYVYILRILIREHTHHFVELDLPYGFCVIQIYLHCGLVLSFLTCLVVYATLHLNGSTPKPQIRK